MKKKDEVDKPDKRTGLSPRIMANIETIGLLNDAHVALLSKEPTPIQEAVELANLCYETGLKQKSLQILSLIPKKYRPVRKEEKDEPQPKRKYKSRSRRNSTNIHQRPKQ